MNRQPIAPTRTTSVIYSTPPSSLSTTPVDSETESSSESDFKDSEQNYQKQISKNLDQFSISTQNAGQKQQSKPSKPTTMAQATKFITKTKNIFGNDNKNHRNPIENEVLREMRQEREKLKMNTHSLASLMAENEAKRVLIEKLKMHLEYYQKQEPIIFKPEIIERFKNYKKNLETDVETSKIKLKREQKYEEENNAKLCQKLNTIDRLQKELSESEACLSKHKNKSCILKQKVAEVKGEIKFLKKTNSDDNRSNTDVIDEIKKVVSHIPTKFRDRLKEAGVLDISEISQDYNEKVENEMVRLQERYNQKEIQYFTKEYYKIDAEVTKKSRTLSDLKMEKESKMRTLHRKQSELKDKMEELERLRHFRRNFKNRVDEQILKHEQLEKICESMRDDIEQKREYIEEYHNLVLDMQKEIGLFEELMVRNDKSKKKAENDKYAKETRLDEINATLTDDDIDRFYGFNKYHRKTYGNTSTVDVEKYFSSSIGSYRSER